MEGGVDLPGDQVGADDAADLPVAAATDETIRGHVFCSFLALVLRQEFEERLEAKGLSLEWADVLSDLAALSVVTLRTAGATCQLRTMPQGVAGQVIQAVGVALGPSVRFLEE